MHFKSLLYLCLLLLGCIDTSPVASADQDKLYFSGYGYQANFASIGEEYPYISSALAGESGTNFGRLLYNSVPDQTSHGTKILKDGLATLAEKPLIVGLVFTSEAVHTEQIGSLHKLLVVLNAQILVFDFNRSEIVAAYPFSSRFIDASNKPFDERDIALHVSQALSSGSDESISTKFLAKVRDIGEGASSTRMIRVISVEIADDAQDALGISSNSDAFKRRLADEFSAKLSKNQLIAVLPANFSQAINNSMAAKMADGAVYNIKIPDADYRIDLVIDGLKKVEYAKNNIGTAFVYGVYASFKFHEPFSGQVFFDEKLKLGQTETVPKTAMTESEGLAFIETINALFDEFTSQIGQQNKQWARTHVYSTKSPEESMKKLNKLIEACR